MPSARVKRLGVKAVAAAGAVAATVMVTVLADGVSERINFSDQATDSGALSTGGGIDPIPDATGWGACPEGYPIKGNVTDVEKIAHPPTSWNYQRTNPERCFSTVEGAIAEGFRAARS